MNIKAISSEPILEIPFLNAGKGQGSFYVDRLPVLTATVEGLPANLDAIVVTADLQGRERFEDSTVGPPRLLGEVLPTRLSEVILPGLGYDALKTGVILAGDFYTVAKPRSVRTNMKPLHLASELAAAGRVVCFKPPREGERKSEVAASKDRHAP